MDYDALRLFLHLSRSLHFGRTSRECHISPSALSRKIKRLEDHVGWPLLERDHHKVALTAAGVAMQVHAAETLRAWNDLGLRLSRKANVLSGQISIFASVTACQSFLPRLLSAFRVAHPEVQIKLETGYAADALGMLGRGLVDVAVAALPDKVAPSLAARVVVVTPLVFVVPASSCETTALCERSPVPWAEVPMVLPATGLARAACDRWFRRRRVQPRIYGEVAGNEALLSLVSLGCGAGVVPRLVADRSPLGPDVKVLKVEPPLGPFRVGVCTPRRKLQSPIVKAFWDSMGEPRRHAKRAPRVDPR
jgi:LysR family positive regulator for ilvC